MKKFLSILALAAMLLLPAKAKAQEAPNQFTQRVYNAVALLYQQDESGGMTMLCTATAYKKVDATTYRFVSASHCVEGKNEEEQKGAKYFVTSDAVGQKTFLAATLVESGNKDAGDDFAIFSVKSEKELPVIPLGDETKLSIGSPLIDVAAPLGLGKQFFQGYLSEPAVDRPPLDAGIVKWHDSMLAMIGGGPGSSGSSLISPDEQAIVGIVVGETGANIGMIVVPISQFKKFEAAVDAGKYKKHHDLSEMLEGLF